MLWQVHLDLGDVRLRSRRVDELRVEARTVLPRGFPGRGDLELRAEVQARRNPLTANGAATFAIGALSPRDVAVIACCAQFVGLKMNPGRIDGHVRRAQPQRYPVEDLRERVGGDRQRGARRIDVDPRPHDDVAEVERARDRRHDDAQAERRAPVRAGQYRRALL